MSNYGRRLFDILILLITLLFLNALFLSCVDQNKDSKGKRQFLKKGVSPTPTPSTINTNRNSNGTSYGIKNGYNQSITGDGSNENFVSKLSPQVELRSFVDPLTGTFREKVTIPKNYNGFLYVSGLNITSLNDRLIKVRFKFGRELESIVVPATIGRAIGLTPQVDLQVLIMDFKSRPFDNIRLLYDLFDYNIYNYETTDAPTQDPYDHNLYCRALPLEYDPTYRNTLCDPSQGDCLYAFAKIRDSGLYDSNGISSIPTKPLIDLNINDFLLKNTPTESELSLKNSYNLEKCLPDNGAVYTRAVGNHRELIHDRVNGNLAGYGDKVLTLISEGEVQNYYFKGPYRLMSVGSWALPTAVAVGENSIFKDTMDGTADLTKGIFSFLFPRAGKLEIPKEVSYIGSDTAFYITGTPAAFTKSSPRNIETLNISGESKWMDGCNLRTAFNDDINNESISSCNVTATVDLLAVDKATGEEKEVPLTTKNEIKLQIVKRSKLNFQNNQTLYQSMRSCSNSRGCASDECCFNKRCWSKELVSQCIEDAGVEGNLPVGSSCVTDYQCSSFCCNTSIGRCAVHNRDLNPPVYCSKSPGEQCVSKEWCRQEVVKKCLIVLTGTSSTGQKQCALRCYNQLQYGMCLEGRCVAPPPPVIPAFDPSNPDCSTAQDPPLVL